MSTREKRTAQPSFSCTLYSARGITKASSSRFVSLNKPRNNWCPMQVLLHQTVSLALQQVADQVISPVATWVALAAMMTLHCGISTVLSQSA